MDQNVSTTTQGLENLFQGLNQTMLQVFVATELLDGEDPTKFDK